MLFPLQSRLCHPQLKPALLHQKSGTDEWPHGSASTDANVQYMGRIDKESDDAILSGDTDLEGAVTTDGQAAGSAN